MSDPVAMLKTAETELATAEAQVEQWRAVVAALRGVVAPRTGTKPTKAATRTQGKESGTDATEAVLREAGRALPLLEIVKLVQRRGYKPEVEPDKLYTRLYTNLSRQKKRFRKAGKARWALIEGAA